MQLRMHTPVHGVFIAVLFAAALMAVVYMAAWSAPPYEPEQPMPFSHATHAGRLGMDCLACHTGAMRSGVAGLPHAGACFVCHRHILPDDPRLRPLREEVSPDFSGRAGKPVEWVRVYKLPDFVKFDHSAHLTRGVSCMACHGAVARMERISAAPCLRMRDCVSCHQSPRGIRPLEEVSSSGYDDSSPESIFLSEQLIHRWNIAPSANCSVCHY
ncbi:MAG: cytochrome c family protein [Akkermansia sp.]|nr:cytochrome c family protein [Akkermansia sp.]